MKYEEYLHWKTLEGTKEFLGAVNKTRWGIIELLASQAGQDPANDNFLRGYQTALNDVMNMTFSEMEVEDETDATGA